MNLRWYRVDYPPGCILRLRLMVPDGYYSHMGSVTATADGRFLGTYWSNDGWQTHAEDPPRTLLRYNTQKEAKADIYRRVIELAQAVWERAMIDSAVDKLQ